MAIYFLYCAIGFLPSFIWLLFYLQKDFRPEPKQMILKVFFWGMMSGLLALIFQLTIRWFCEPTSEWSYFFASLGENDFRFILNILVFAPITEEFVKYLAVRQTALKDPAFDEPVDAMIYMIVSALGFAAAENILQILPGASPMTLVDVSAKLTVRFLSATFLHTLSSAILGYFLALSIFNLKSRRKFIALGFIFSIAAHSFYNFLVLTLNSTGNILMAGCMAGYFIFISAIIFWQFNQLKKIAAVCRIKS